MEDAEEYFIPRSHNKFESPTATLELPKPIGGDPVAVVIIPPFFEYAYSSDEGDIVDYILVHLPVGCIVTRGSWTTNSMKDLLDYCIGSPRIFSVWDFEGKFFKHGERYIPTKWAVGYSEPDLENELPKNQVLPWWKISFGFIRVPEGETRTSMLELLMNQGTLQDGSHFIDPMHQIGMT